MLLLGLLACADPAPPATRALVFEQAELSMQDGTTLRLAQATIDPEGKGQGQGASAVSPGAPPLQIDAPTSDWDLKAREARFTGGVTAVRGDVTLTCQVLRVRFASADRVQTAVAEGDVRVVQGDRAASGARAELNAETGEIALTGDPRISEGANTMTGARIALWLDDDRVRCDQCRLVVAGDAIAPRAGP